jgi:GNAT superfamily N-acetyltransferase
MTLPAGFLELPFEVYREDPQWIPETSAEVAAAFSEHNPWLKGRHARAFCTPGRVRCAGFFDPGSPIEGQSAAFFGYWESQGDDEADAALSAQVEDWARALGAQCLYGPVNFSTALGYRWRLSGNPDVPPFPGEPYNRSEYPARMERLGYRLCRRYLTQYIGPEHQKALLDRRRHRLESLRQQGFRFERVDPKEWLARLKDTYALADASFRENFAYTKPSFEQFSAIFGERLLATICPDTSVVAYAPSGELVGVFLVYPHYGPLVVQGAGAKRVNVRELSFQVHAPLLAAFPPVTNVLKTLAVHPSHRGNGLSEALTCCVFEWGSGRYPLSLGALIREGNFSGKLAYDTPLCRQYGLYRKDLSA